MFSMFLRWSHNIGILPFAHHINDFIKQNEIESVFLYLNVAILATLSTDIQLL